MRRSRDKLGEACAAGRGIIAKKHRCIPNDVVSHLTESRAHLPERHDVTGVAHPNRREGRHHPQVPAGRGVAH